MGIQFRYQAGKVQVNHNRFLGYTKDEEGNLIIEPEEAEIIKRIYREYLEGASLKDICDSLMADNILTGAGKEKWIPSTVHKILTNEKYIGDALLQKTVTTDFLEKKRQANNGLAPQYYVEGSHEPIIPKHIFMRVQKNWSEEQIYEVALTVERKESTVVNMLFQAFVLARNVGMYIAELHGTIGGRNTRYGELYQSGTWSGSMRCSYNFGR